MRLDVCVCVCVSRSSRVYNATVTPNKGNKGATVKAHAQRGRLKLSPPYQAPCIHFPTLRFLGLQVRVH